MCLGIPMKVLEINGNKAVAEAAGVRKDIRLDLLDDVQVGEFVLIHTGFAIEKLDPREAAETLELIKQVFEAGAETRENNRRQ
jgi:hydrogenase expression/formation protein HypC